MTYQGILGVVWCIKSYKSVFLGYLLEFLGISVGFPRVYRGFQRRVWDTNESPMVSRIFNLNYQAISLGFHWVLWGINFYESVLKGYSLSSMGYPWGSVGYLMVSGISKSPEGVSRDIKLCYQGILGVHLGIKSYITGYPWSSLRYPQGVSGITMGYLYYYYQSTIRVSFRFLGVPMGFLGIPCDLSRISK